VSRDRTVTRDTKIVRHRSICNENSWGKTRNCFWYLYIVQWRTVRYFESDKKTRPYILNISEIAKSIDHNICWAHLHFIKEPILEYFVFFLLFMLLLISGYFKEWVNYLWVKDEEDNTNRSSLKELRFQQWIYYNTMY